MEIRKENDMFRIEWCDRPIVRVLGTVMTRDDSLGGWVPLMNGGQSKVGIHESVDGNRFRIYGRRTNDKQVTLDCLIQRNMIFHETIGTFHHWKVDDKKLGLTFYTPAEARSFNRGVRVALEKLSRITEYDGSSTSSTCSRLSDEHQSSCTSPASSTGSSSTYEISAFVSQRMLEKRNKLSTSSASSSSSRYASRNRRSPSARNGKLSLGIHNSTSSGASMKKQNLIGYSYQAVMPPVSVAPTLSLLSSTTSPLLCETPSNDKCQPHFRWPLPQQQPSPANLTFLNRPITKEGSLYELSPLTLPVQCSASSAGREADLTSHCKHQVSLLENGRGEVTKVIASAVETNESLPGPLRDCVTLTVRQNRHSHGRRGRSHSHQGVRPRHTKTPHLDILERQRDLKPTEPNSYVLFSSSKPATTLGSQQIGGRSLTTGVTTAYKPLSQMTVIDGYQYHPMISTMRSTTYQPPQSGALSIMASSADAQLFSRSDTYYTSNIDCIKDDLFCYEPRSSLISSTPKKTKYEVHYSCDNMTDIAKRRHSSDCSCCCPRFTSLRSRQRSNKFNRYEEDLAERSKCRHCHEMFNHELNKPGSCRDSPDRCLESINKVTCMFCVNSLFYHCCRDDEGDYDDDPCSCTNAHGASKSKLLRRWSALAVLSVIFPCLCLYPPLLACHNCGVACHCCGGKHQAPFPSSKGRNKQKQ